MKRHGSLAAADGAAVVELDEGPHLTSSVVNARLDDLAIGQRLRVDFEDYAELSIPIFRVNDSSGV